MAYIYRYIDNEDKIIKYVGIVWSKNRSLKQRINEHKHYDKWCKNKEFTIEYIEENIITRTDAEYFESHYISLYGTDKYYNEKKSGWGISSFLPNRENDWIKYDDTFKENKINFEVISEKEMASLLVDELFEIKTDKDRTTFGRKLRSKRNSNLIKTEKEKEYWETVIELIDNEVATRLFGEKCDRNNINVFVNGCGQIVINLKEFFTLKYYPNNKTFKIKNNKFKNSEIAYFFDDIINLLNQYKTILVKI